MKEVTLKIDGMHCDGCVRRVKAALGKLEGVRIEHVEVGSAKVAYDPASQTPAGIAAAVTGIGFTAAAV